MEKPHEGLEPIKPEGLDSEAAKDDQGVDLGLEDEQIHINVLNATSFNQSRCLELAKITTLEKRMSRLKQSYADVLYEYNSLPSDSSRDDKVAIKYIDSMSYLWKQIEKCEEKIEALKLHGYH